MKRFQRILSILLIFTLVCLPLLPRKAAALTESEKEKYGSLEEAAETVRKTLAAQKSSVTVRFQLEDPMHYGRYKLNDVLLAEAFKHTGVPDEGDYLRWSFQSWGGDGSEVFDGKTHYVTSQIVKPEYNATATQEKELDTKLEQVMASLALEGKTDYEKIEAIYKYVCENVRYSEEVLLSGADTLKPPEELKVYYSAYGALVLGSTTCQGFSSLIYRMMLEAGIDCRLIAGGEHGWNIVKLDGKYYFLEATWDEANWKQRGELEYFLKGSASFLAGGRKDGSNYSTYLHAPWAEFYTADFLQAYPISVLDYGQKDLSTQPAGTVLGSGKCGDKVKWKLTADGKLTISGSGKMWGGDAVWYHNNNGMSRRWDGLNGYIKTVEIQSGVTAIGDFAFYNCPQLTQVNMADTVTSIGASAFGFCEGLTEFTIPDTVKTVGAGAFKQCPRLETVKLSAGMKELPAEMFLACTGLKTVHIPQGIKTIGDSAFNTCPKLGSIQLPSSVTTLGAGAFAQSFDPEEKISMTIPETVTEIGWACFEGSGLREVIWNARAKTVGLATFNLCHYLENIVFSDSVTEMQDLAIPDCDNLKTVKLSANLKKMGDRVFQNAELLQEIVVPAGVQAIGEGLFIGCTGLQRVVFQGSAPQVVTEADNTMVFPGGVVVTVYYPKDDPTWTEEYRNSLVQSELCAVWKEAHGAQEAHTWDGTEFDDTHHWSTCSGCWETDAVAEHSFGSDCSNQCQDCGFTRQALHNYSEEWKKNDREHWHECADCGTRKDRAVHISLKGKACPCGFTEAEPSQPTESLPSQPVESTPTQPQQPGDSGPDLTVVIVAAVVVLLGGGVAVVIFKKKKSAG